MKSAVIFAVVITFNAVLGMSLRHKRQSSDDNDENNLEDRYGWNRPQPNWGDRPWQRPRPDGNQRPRPNQGNQWPGGNDQRPNQGGNEWQQPDQGNQWENNGQTNQGGNQWNNQNGNGQNQQQNNGQPRPTPTPNSNGSTTESPAVAECIRNCPVTSEYNPVCGTNMVQYPNPGRLTCAQTCGVNVSLFRASSCPVTTTAAPS